MTTRPNITDIPSLDKPDNKLLGIAPSQVVVQPEAVVPTIHLAAATYVQGFKFAGNSVFTSTDLSKLLKPYIHKKLNVAQIYQAADVITHYYRKKGYFVAQAFVPPQNIKSGYVTLLLVEGHINKKNIGIDNPGRQIKTATVKHILECALKPGSVITHHKIERALLLLNDRPGISATATLIPGDEVGSGHLLVKIRDLARVSGHAEYDNFGTYETGQNRFGSTLFLNSPTGHGASVTLHGLVSDNALLYGYGNVMMPVGANGLRLGTAFSGLRYRLKTENSDGRAIDMRLFSEYPFVRTRQTNLMGTLEYTYLNLSDTLNGSNSSRRSIHDVTATLNGDHRDNFGGGGVSTASIGMTGGSLDLDGNKTFKALDAATAQTAGGFVRLDGSLARHQAISGPWSTYVALSGQYAFQNLDSSQQFTMGGPFSMPGYPVGEVFGDLGLLLHTDLRYSIASPPWKGKLQLLGIYSVGFIQLHHTTWANWQGTNTTIKNHFSLQSVAIGFVQNWHVGSIRFLASRLLGERSPSRDPITGTFSDNSKGDYRYWVQGGLYF